MAEHQTGTGSQVRRLWLRWSLLGTVALACNPSKPNPPSSEPPGQVEQLAVFDPAGIGRGQPPPTLQVAPPSVIDYGPRESTGGGGEIHVRFDQAVKPLGDRDPSSLSIHLDPSVPGHSEWKTPDLLVFVPDEPLEDAHTYRVEVQGSVEAPTGVAWQGPFGWTFTTRRPVVYTSYPGDRTRNVSRLEPLFIEFSQPVELAVVREHLRVETGQPDALEPTDVQVTRTTRAEAERHHLSWDATDTERRLTVRPKGAWPRNSRVHAIISAGVVGKRGPLPTREPWSTSFDTVAPLEVVAYNCTSKKPCGFESISLELNNPIDARTLKKIQVSPKPKRLRIDLLDDWDGEGGTDIRIDGIFMPGKTYTVVLPAGMRDLKGERLANKWEHRAVFGYVPSLGLDPETGILQADGRRRIGIVSRHLKKVSIRAAVFSDADLELLAPTNRGSWYERWPKQPLTTVEREWTLNPKGPTDWSALPVDLRALVGDSRRPIAVEVSAEELTPRAGGEDLPDTVRAIYRVTDLGPEVYVGQAHSVVAVHRFSDGRPVAGAQVSRRVPGDMPISLGTTDPQGLLELDDHAMPELHSDRGILVARSGSDVAVLTDDGFSELRHDRNAYDQEKWLRTGERMIGKLISERGAYRPGELVRVVGWLGVETPYVRTGLRRLSGERTVDLELFDSRGDSVAKKTVEMTQEGKYWAELTIPRESKLGRFHVVATAGKSRFLAYVKVEDYRTPEFEVSASMPKTDWVRGASPTVNVHANYYFGGHVPMTKVRSRTSCRASSYRPPGLPSGWAVGIRDWSYGVAGGPQLVHALGERDRQTGSHSFTVTPPVTENRVSRCRVSVGVQDISRQEIGAEASFTVHPASHYLALYLPRHYLWTHEQLDVPVLIVDWEGTRAAGRVTVTMTRTWDAPQYRKVKGKRVYEGVETREKTVKTCTLDAAASGELSSCALKQLETGTYKIVAEATFDGNGARSEGVVHVWRSRVANHSVQAAPPKTLTIEASRTEVHPGDTVDVTVRGPWNGASGMLVTSRAGVREAYPFVLQNYRADVSLKADDSWSPGVSLDASVALGRSGGYPKLKRASKVWIEQGVDHRRLEVAVKANAHARPRDKVKIAVDVRDSNGNPVDGRLALWAVDEGVLALTDYQVPDILKEFVPAKTSGVYARDDYSDIVRSFTPYGDPRLSLGGYGMGYGRGSGSGFGGKGKRVQAGGVVPARQKFETTPLFLGDLAVRGGKARSEVHIPDNLTTFRVFAVASSRLTDNTSPGRFGVGESRIQVSTPLMIRPALPRTLRPNDRTEVAAIIQNNTSTSGQVEVHMRELVGPGNKAQAVAKDKAALGFRTPAVVTQPIAAGEQVRVPFSVDALHAQTSFVEFEAHLTAGQQHFRDRVQVELPIAPEATLTERVAMYGSLNSDKAVGIPVAIPRDVLPDHGGVHLSTSSSLLAGLEDAVVDLVHYPYGCIEQTSSRLLPLVALAELSATYPLGLGDVDSFVRVGIERILSMQTREGGFAYWPGGTEAHAYATAYATWVLTLAKDAGYRVSDGALDQALGFLERELQPGKDGELGHQRYHSYVRQAIAAYTLARAGRNVDSVLDRLYTRREAMPVFARAFVLMAQHRAHPDDPRTRALASEVLGELAEQPGTAHVKERLAYDLQAVFHSSTRSDAIVLLGLLEVVPDHPVVEKLARGLLGERVGGRWRNTQENAYAVMALAAYARVYEGDEPDFVARAWAGRQQVLDTSFRGRTFRHESTSVAMVDLLAAAGRGPAVETAAPDPISMIVQRVGQGRMYYRLGVEWAPAGENLPASTHGLAITRTLRGEDGQPLAGRALAPGELVSLDLTIEGHTRVPYVVVDAPIPAGLEVVQRSLGRGQAATALGGARGFWVSHEELRRDRALVFADNLPVGTLRHSVPLRATTPGRYAMPPAQTQAMYMPEIYGRSTGTVIEVR